MPLFRALFRNRLGIVGLLAAGAVLCSCGSGGGGGGSSGGGAKKASLEVRDKKTGAVIPNAEVWFYEIWDQESALYGGANLRGDRPHLEATISTDADGLINITDNGMKEIDMWVFVRHEGYLARLKHYSVYEANLPLKFTIEMTPVPDSLPAENVYSTVYEQLLASSSAVGSYATRRSALDALDKLLAVEPVEGPHTTAAGSSSMLDDYRMLCALQYQKMEAGIAVTAPTLTIWRHYNEGVVIKEGDSAIAVDLIIQPLLLNDTGLFDHLSGVFATHEHRDHLDGLTARMCAKADIDFYVPAGLTDADGFEDIEWEFHNRVDLKDCYVPLSDGQTVVCGGWTVKAYATYHNATNLSYLITSPSGVTIFHTGDGQISSLPAEFHEDVQVDYFIHAIWLGDPGGYGAAFDESIIIPVHENELGHGIGDRDPFTTIDSYSPDVLPRIQPLIFGESTQDYVGSVSMAAPR